MKVRKKNMDFSFASSMYVVTKEWNEELSPLSIDKIKSESSPGLPTTDNSSERDLTSSRKLWHDMEPCWRDWSFLLMREIREVEGAAKRKLRAYQASHDVSRP